MRLQKFTRLMGPPLLMIATPLLGIHAAMAQDALPAAQADPQNFRLDKPADAKPATPALTPAPQATPSIPKVKSKKPDAAHSVQKTSEKLAPKTRSTVHTSETQTTVAPEAPQQSASTAPTDALTPANTIPSSPNAPITAAVAPPANVPPQQAIWTGYQIPIAAGISALLLLLLGLFLWRRKKPHVAVFDNAEEIPIITETESPVSADAAIEEKTAAENASIPAAPPPTDRPLLEISFVPETAVIGFSSLTLRGELHVANLGQATAIAPILQCAIISANRHQTDQIEAFHKAQDDVNTESIADMPAGERLIIRLETVIPLNELHSHMHGEQQLLVPILIANLRFSWDDENARDMAKLACLIGRETNPPTAKMGALRLDLGPRSFNELGQRAL